MHRTGRVNTFMSLFSFPRKYQKTRGLLIISGDMEGDR